MAVLATQAATEAGWLGALDRIPIWRPPAQPMLVIAPHPDDETLGAGGLIAAHRRRSLPMLAVAVTDGEGAYEDVADLGAIRKLEQEAALACLGVERFRIVRLRMPDGQVSCFEDRIVDLLEPYVDSDTLVVAPWNLDPHPDHEACGRAAERICRATGATLAAYFFWTWHWSELKAIENLPLYRFPLDEELQNAKHFALVEHDSQLHHPKGRPILTEARLQPMERSFETYAIYDYGFHQ